MSWTLIEHQALSSSAASVTLGSGGTIPQTYKTLKLVMSIRGTSTTVIALYAQWNGSGANQTGRTLSGTGTITYSGTALSLTTTIGGQTYARVSDYYVNDANTTSNTFTSFDLTIPNYAGSTNKPFSIDWVSEANATAAYQEMSAGLWSQTAAITSIKLAPNSNDFASGSTFTLYGLA